MGGVAKGCAIAFGMIEFGKRIVGVSHVQRTGSYAVIQNASNAIALGGTPKGYFLLGGGVEPDEGLEHGLRREILEEIGYDALKEQAT